MHKGSGSISYCTKQKTWHRRHSTFERHCVEFQYLVISDSAQSAAVLACKPSKCWHYHDTSCQESKRRPRPELQNYNAEIMVGLKLYCILIFTIDCPLPPCHGAIHRKGLGQGRTHSSLLTQQNQAQNVFIIIHTPPTRHNDTAFCHDHRTQGGRNAGLPGSPCYYLSIAGPGEKEEGRAAPRVWPRSELNIVKLVTRHWAVPPPPAIQQERNKMQ